ncbi:MAG TPA: YdeI/OmpD-associated family protein [Usitatibacter sp.]|nr:YdeI/OmpD-associated family protein [Usitatibacter sp.]
MPRFFASAVAFRAWLTKCHARRDELWVGFYKVGSGKRGLTYAQAVEEALCFGWIDGIKKRVDESAYMHRFTPRGPRSIWSVINVRRAKRLIEEGRMCAAGLKAFEARDPRRTGGYSFENREAAFDADSGKRFRGNRKAWHFFATQPPGYRRLATFWVMSARKDQTRERRLAQLVEASARGERLGAVTGG